MNQPAEAVVVATSRTPLAKSFRGSLNRTRPDDMAAHCIRNVLAKAPALPHGEVEDVIVGCGFPEGQQGDNVARIAAGLAGLPVGVAAVTVNRFCSSGLQAVAMAAHQIMLHGAKAAIGGGVESITHGARVKPEPHPQLAGRAPGYYMRMGDTAEVVARRYTIGRREQDEFALQSQQRTAAAQERGLHDAELAPMRVTQVPYCQRRLEIPMEKLNVNGGAISIGHPFGMTGSRLVGTLALEMPRRQAGFGIVTMCIGGGQGMAGLFELCV